jgi:hypothetical protein
VVLFSFVCSSACGRAPNLRRQHTTGALSLGLGFIRLFRLVLLAIRRIADKKQGATGITTVAPYIAGQWGRGE